MTDPNTTPVIKPEIVSPPSLSNLSVSQVGAGMFSVTMQVIMVVRFPNDSEPGVVPPNHVISQTPESTQTVLSADRDRFAYGNGELPTAFEGEAEGFQAFVQVHGYLPPTREVLIQWATNSQGGA